MEPVLKTDDGKYILEEVQLEESDNDIPYEEVPIESDSSDENDLKGALRNLKAASTDEIPRTASEDVQSEKRYEQPKVVIDDFFRNFLHKHELKKTLETFQQEWYEICNRGKDEVIRRMEGVPDCYTQMQILRETINDQQQKLEVLNKITNKAKEMWDRLRNERNHHRMHHRRVVQEKNEMIKKMKRIKKHCQNYEPALQALKQRYENVMKDKMLMRLERDKMQIKMEAMEARIKSLESMQQAVEEPKEDLKEETVKDRAEQTEPTLIPAATSNPYLAGKHPPDAINVEKFTLQKTFPGHLMPISRIAIHPTKDIVATVSDDKTWKMWAIPSGELLMSGDGHREWLSDCDFHPSGAHLATTSGDCTVKLWDFVKSKCTLTFTCPATVWGCAFHPGGDFLASCSMDHTTKLWDLPTENCRQTFRGHVDSVNYVLFQPWSNNICTASGDKTLSFWDIRTGLCIQTFYGHHNAVNHMSFNEKGDLVSSCDADGVVKIWDVRMVGELIHIPTGDLRFPANETGFDPSGTRLFVCSDDGTIKIYNPNDGSHIVDLAGHEDAVNAALYSAGGKYLISASGDSSFRVWG